MKLKRRKIVQKVNNRLFLSVTVLTLLLITGCNNNSGTNNTEHAATAETVDSTAVENIETYQHIVLATIQEEKWDEYVIAMQNNIAHSRREAGNIIFTLFQPEDGSHKVAFIERYINNTAFEEHSNADYIPKQLTKESLVGEMELIALKEVPEVPAAEPENASEISASRNVIVFFDVKPEKRQTFIDGLVEVTPYSRKAPGNIRFNIFQQANDENKFVLLESWESAAAHEKHQAQDYSEKLNEQLEGVFVSNPGDTRWLAKDISQ